MINKFIKISQLQIEGLEDPIQNTELIKKYYDSIKSIVEEIPINNAEQIDYLSHIMRMPDIMLNEKETISIQEWSNINSLIKNAIEELIIFRKNEGKVIDDAIKEQVHGIESLLQLSSTYEKERIDIIKDRIKKNIDSLTDKETFDNYQAAIDEVF